MADIENTEEYFEQRAIEDICRILKISPKPTAETPEGERVALIMIKQAARDTVTGPKGSGLSLWDGELDQELCANLGIDHTKYHLDKMAHIMDGFTDADYASLELRTLVMMKQLEQQRDKNAVVDLALMLPRTHAAPMHGRVDVWTIIDDELAAIELKTTYGGFERGALANLRGCSGSGKTIPSMMARWKHAFEEEEKGRYYPPKSKYPHAVKEPNPQRPQTYKVRAAARAKRKSQRKARKANR